MSFILDALKKLDSEKRGIDQELSVSEQLLVQADAEDWQQGGRLSRRVSVRLGPLVLVCLLALLGTGSALWFLERTFRRSESPVASLQRASSESMLVARTPTGHDRPGPAAALTDIAEDDTPAEPATAKDGKGEMSIPLLTDSDEPPVVNPAEQFRPVSEARSANNVVPEESNSIPLPIEEPSTAPGPKEIASAEEGPVEVQKEVSGGHTGAAPPVLAAAPQPLLPQPPVANPVAATTDQSLSSSSPPSSSLPAPDRSTSQPPKMRINMIAWREDEPKAVVNMQTVYEGDMIGEVKVIKINQNTVEFEYHGQTFTVRF